MRQRAPFTPWSVLLALALAGAALASLGGPLLASGGGDGSTGSSGTGAAAPSLLPGAPADDGATPAVPEPGLVDPQPTAWDHVVVSPDGRTLTVYYWNGAEACYGLARVEVTSFEGGIGIRLWTGLQPEAASRICIEIAQLYKTVIVLDQPLITGGAS